MRKTPASIHEMPIAEQEIIFSIRVNNRVYNATRVNAFFGDNNHRDPMHPSLFAIRGLGDGYFQVEVRLPITLNYGPNSAIEIVLYNDYGAIERFLIDYTLMESARLHEIDLHENQ